MPEAVSDRTMQWAKELIAHHIAQFLAGLQEIAEAAPPDGEVACRIRSEMDYWQWRLKGLRPQNPLAT